MINLFISYFFHMFTETQKLTYIFLFHTQNEYIFENANVYITNIEQIIYQLSINI